MNENMETNEIEVIENSEDTVEKTRTRIGLGFWAGCFTAGLCAVGYKKLKEWRANRKEKKEILAEFEEIFEPDDDSVEDNEIDESEE